MNNENATTIVINGSLPSKGLIYSEPIITEYSLRSMDTIDEMKRLNASQDYQYKILCDIIDDCTTSQKSISAYDLCLGDYQYLLHRLRVATYGNIYKLRSKCPYCLSVEDNEVDLDSIPVLDMDMETIHKCKVFELPVTKHKIEIYHQTPRLLDIISKAISDDRKRTKQDRGIIITLSKIIQKIDDEPVDVMRIENFCSSLPMGDTNSIFKHSEKLTKSIGLDLDLTVECEVCGYNFPTTFRTTSEFFGPSVDL